jgi:zinc protease
MDQIVSSKGVMERVRAVLWFLLPCLIFFVQSGWCGQTQVESPPQQGTGGLEMESEWVDRVLPSKPDDLFVILQNGLTVMIREAHGSKVVSCQALVKTGSIFEGDRMGGGLSHYLEHVVSGGTTSTLTEAQISEKLQAIGGASNAYTSYDDTVYFINTISAHYEEALELLLAYVTDCQFNETEYEREKGVILQEFQLGENDPSQQLWESFMKTAYREHPVRHPVIGEKDVFLKMNREDLLAHYRRWYTPENMVIAVVGDVNKGEVLRVVLSLAGSLKRAADPPYVLPPEPRQLAPRSVEKALPIARLTKACLGFRTVPLTDPDLYALDVLAIILGDGRTSRLYQAVRDNKGLVLSISAWSWTPPFAQGQFSISMDLPYENLAQAVDAVWTELSDVKENVVAEEALKRAKKKVVADYVFGQESVQSKAGQLASDWVATGDPYFGETYVSKIQEVTAEAVRRVAQKYFRKDGMTLAVVRPPSVEAGRREPEPEGDLETGIERQVLPNGMTLLLKRSAAAPIVSFQFFAKGGLRFERPDQTGLCHFMASLLTKGTVTRSKLEIARTLEDVGGRIEASSGNNVVGLSVSVLKDDFDIALDLLADVVRHPSFPENEIEKQRQDTLMAIQKLDEEWTTEITRLFKRHYYRKHPYRNDVLGTAETVKRFSQEDIRGLYETVMKPNNAVLAIFGDVDLDGVTSRVKKAFEGFEPAISEYPIIELETHNIEEDEAFETLNEKTSVALLVGFNGLALGDPDAPVVDVLDAVISGIGYPSGWLHEALRGRENSLVYYVHAYPVFGIDGGYFGIMSQTTPENYEKVLKIILEQLDVIQEREIDAKTLERGKNMCITMRDMGLETVAAQAASCALNEILGLGYDYDMGYGKLIEKVSAADVLRVAKRLFSHHLIVATRPNS